MYTPDAAQRRALRWAAVSTAVLLLLTFAGTQGFRALKLTEGGYLLGTFLFVAGSAYRLGHWSSQPGVRMYLKGAFKRLLFMKLEGARPVRTAADTAVNNLGAQRFIFRRGFLRGLAHIAMSWGCLLSFALTFPLVLGMMKFKLVGPETYQAVAVGMPLMKFAVHGWFATVMFNALNLSALLMVFGLALAYWNRRRLNREQPEVRPEWDMTPLHVLMAVGLTGLAITADYKLAGGKSYLFWAITHQMAVVGMLIWFPFSKLFHMFMRPLAISIKVYQHTEGVRAQAACKMCQKPFIPQQQAEDLKGALGEQGISLPVMGLPGQPIPDRQMVDYCLDCKRLIRARRYVNLEVSHS